MQEPKEPLSDWYFFHESLVGFDFRRRSDGCVVGKVGIFNLFKDQPEVLKQLMEDKHLDYTKVDKPYYKDGRYVGIFEGEIKSRIYKNCPELNKHKKRFSNE